MEKISRRDFIKFSALTTAEILALSTRASILRAAGPNSTTEKDSSPEPPSYTPNLAEAREQANETLNFGNGTVFHQGEVSISIPEGASTQINGAIHIGEVGKEFASAKQALTSKPNKNRYVVWNNQVYEATGPIDYPVDFIPNGNQIRLGLGQGNFELRFTRTNSQGQEEELARRLVSVIANPNTEKPSERTSNNDEHLGNQPPPMVIPPSQQ